MAASASADRGPTSNANAGDDLAGVCIYSCMILSRKPVPAMARVAAAGERPFTGHMLDMPKGISDAAIQ